MAGIQNELDVIFNEQREVFSALRHDRDVVRRFLNRDGAFIQRSIDSPSNAHLPGDNHATCTAFCLYYLTRSGLVVPHDTSDDFVVLTEDEARRICTALGDALSNSHNIASSPAKRRGKQPRTDTFALPNQYNSSIQVAGYLIAARLLQLCIPEGVLDACKSVVIFLARLVSTKGYVPRIESSHSLPSHYLTFWAGVVFQEWKRASAKSDGDAHTPSAEDGSLAMADESLRAIGKWSESALAEGLAYHHSGLASKFDIIELAYSAITAIEFSGTPEARQMAKCGVSTLFKCYFRDGCFGPSAPVLADQQNYSLLVPSAECLALLLMTDLEIFLGFWRDLQLLFNWLREHRVEKIGWYSEHDVRYGRPTAFMTVSSLVFLFGLTKLLDIVLSDGASQELRVPPYALDTSVAKIDYPQRIGEILHTSIIKPITERQYSDLASYSMILYGPPGTSKTTIARKLAQDLRWPLLILNQSDFLKNGIPNIDAEADRIFRLAYYLKEVVILFDEVEELVEARPSPDKLSRLLTTSMLPRIHTLRDRQRVVFIFATNHLQGIDKAASRRGRFDIIQCIMPPSDEERRQMLDGISQRFFLRDPENPQHDQLRQLLETEKVVDRTRNFGYKDLEALLRRVLAANRIEGRELAPTLLAGIIRDIETSIDKSEIEKFEQSRSTLERR